MARELLAPTVPLPTLQKIDPNRNRTNRNFGNSGPQKWFSFPDHDNCWHPLCISVSKVSASIYGQYENPY